MKLSESTPWIDYWEKDDFWANSVIWQRNAELLIKNVAGVLSLGPQDEVLTIGCGGGQLEALLAPQVRSLLATDVSRSFLQLSQSRCKKFPNVHVQPLPETYTDLSGLGTFSQIFCVSVIQYYQSKEEVEDLLRSAKSVLKPGGKLLLADIPVHESFLSGGKSILQSWRDHYWHDLLQTFLRLKMQSSSYKTAAAKYPTLDFDRAEFENLAQRVNFKITWVQKPLSVHVNRLNLLIEFPS